MKVTRADWAASTPWVGITGKPAWLSGPTPAINRTTTMFVGGGAAASATDSFMPLNAIGVATRRQPPGLPYGPTQDVIWQEVFDVMQYGASGAVDGDDTDAFNHAIADLNTAGRGCLRLPACNYQLPRTPNAITVPCSIVGDGAGVANCLLGGNGFTGGSGGNWFEVSGVSFASDGTSSTAITLTDGTAAGLRSQFSFHDLDLVGVHTGIAINAPDRAGFIGRCRVAPLALGLSINCAGVMAGDLTFYNLGDTAAMGISLAGNDHVVHDCRFLSFAARWARAIACASGERIELANLLVHGTLNEAVSLTTAGRVRLTNLAFGDVQGAPPVVFSPLLHYVNELTGMGGNADSSYDLRKELAATVVWNPDSLRPLESTTKDITVTGARFGDQVAIGTADNTDYLMVSGRVVSDDTIRITLQNVSINTVDLGSATYKCRIFN